MKRMKMPKIPAMAVILIFFISAIIIDKMIYPAKMKEETQQVAKQAKELKKVQKDTNTSYSE